jgi:hypothetical protein
MECDWCLCYWECEDCALNGYYHCIECDVCTLDRITNSKEIQYLAGGVWKKATKNPPIYIIKDSTVQFKAIKLREERSWRANQPEWYDNSGVIDTGVETISVVYNTLSTSAEDYKIIKQISLFSTMTNSR